MVRRLRLTGRAAAWLPRLLVAFAIVLLHWLLIQQLADRMALRLAEAAMPARLQVVYLQQLDFSDPPAAVAAAPFAIGRFAEPVIAEPLTLAAPLPAASQPGTEPAQDASPASPAAEAATASTEDVPEGAVARRAEEASAAGSADPALAPPVAAEDGPVRAEPAASVAAIETRPGAHDGRPAFEWPVSTRLSYQLDGHYRGEVNGTAQVEWINAAPHYQVHLDVNVGLPFAPLFTRRMRSDGRIAANGLQPERYTEASQLAFRAAQTANLRIDANGVRDGRGRHWPVRDMASRIAVQDSASQFVQLSWLFSTQPELLTAGQLIEFELALPRRLARWTYEVGQPHTIHTPFGPVEAVHVYPRAGTERGGDLLAQAWFAPRLAHLPVRIRIEQSTDVWLDLVLERRPELAAN